MSRITKCPHCGSTQGLFQKRYAQGPVSWRFGFQGEELDNGDMYDLLGEKPGKWLYCIDCEKRVCSAAEWEGQQ